jgi:hypothetical protein
MGTDHGIEDIGDATAESLKALQDELIDARLPLQGGVSGRLRVMRNFLRWCRRNGYAELRFGRAPAVTRPTGPRFVLRCRSLSCPPASRTAQPLGKRL